MPDRREDAVDSSLRILVVDDQAKIRKMIRQILQRIGYRKIDEADDGDSAWHMLDQSDYDLLIVDWNMPQVTGAELLRRVRASEKLRGVPFVMVTAEAEHSYVARAVESGVDDYLLKPITAMQLEERVARVLRRRRHPSDLDKVLALAEDLHARGETLKAREEYERAMQKWPRNAKIPHCMGLLHEEIGNLDVAEKYFKLAIDINPQFAAAHDSLGMLYARREQLENAILSLNEALRLSPDNPMRLVSLGKICLRDGRKEAAKALFEKARAIDPGHPGLEEILRGMEDDSDSPPGGE